MNQQPARNRYYWKRGEPLVWLTGSAVTIILGLALLLIVVVMVTGLGYFWPDRITFQVKNSPRLCVPTATAWEGSVELVQGTTGGFQS